MNAEELAKVIAWLLLGHEHIRDAWADGEAVYVEGPMMNEGPPCFVVTVSEPES